MVKGHERLARARPFPRQILHRKGAGLSRQSLSLFSSEIWKLYPHRHKLKPILKQKFLIDKWHYKMTMGQVQGLQALLVILSLQKKLPRHIIMNKKEVVLGSDKLTNSLVLNQISASDLSKGIKVPKFFIGHQYNRGEVCSLREYKIFLDGIIASKGKVRVYHHQFGSMGRLNIKNLKKESLQYLYNNENQGRPSGVLSAVGYFLERKFIALKHLKHKRMMLLGVGP